MSFSLTPQQLEFREAVRSVLAKECSPADVRTAYRSPSWRTPRWSALAELGVVGLTVPEAHGGLGLGMVDMAVVLEEAGRVALPEPLAATAAICAPLLVDLEASRSAGRRWARWLEGMATGEVAAAVGLGTETEPVAGANGATVCALGRPAHGPEAAIFLLAVEQSAASGECRVEPVTSLDPTRRLARVVPAVGVRPVATGPVATELAARTARRAAVATAAELVGLSDRLITIGAEYASTRAQFGRPIGSFQAVKHLLAGARVKLEFARPAVYAAAWSLDEDVPDAGRRASAAKAQASEVATQAARVALQVHGAIGYTWECDLQLFLKRSWALAAAWGSAAEHRRRVLDSLLAERMPAAQGTAKA